MPLNLIADWDDAYANRDHIPDADGFIARWVEEAAAWRAERAAKSRVDIAYGPTEREAFDLFLPDGGPEGLLVFVHGGYWRAFSRSDWSHLARGPVAAGWAVAMPSYTLCPDATLPEIAAQVSRAIHQAATSVQGPIILVGHSAGGQIVTRLSSAGSVLSRMVVERLHHVVSISGVHDLRPLLKTQINRDLRLDFETAVQESPALLHPREGLRFTAWVGGNERPEFIRQSQLLANIWLGCGAATRSVIEDGRHHFDVIDGLEAAESPLCRVILDG
ncbi:MAG: alpha/beta hydrolase [Rubricella sp.]